MPDQTELEDGKIPIFVDRENLGAIFSCLMHAKFNDEIRMEFCLSPVLNELIRTVLEMGRKINADSMWFKDSSIFKIDPHEFLHRESIFFKIRTALEIYPSDKRQIFEEIAFYPYSMEKGGSIHKAL